MGIAIYEMAEKAIGRTAGILHQRALYEMRLDADRAALDRAEALVREALLIDPQSNAIEHTQAEIAFRRSQLARSPEEAAFDRREATSIARRLSKSARTSYAHHTLAKIAIADVTAAIAEDNRNPSELSTQALNAAIQAAEGAVRDGLNQFPNDQYILMAEAELSSLLRNADRALAALLAAFEKSSRSELVANRLASLLVARGDYERAGNTLKTAISANPGSRSLNLRYAKILMHQKPGIDFDQPELMLAYPPWSMGEQPNCLPPPSRECAAPTFVYSCRAKLRSV